MKELIINGIEHAYYIDDELHIIKDKKTNKIVYEEYGDKNTFTNIVDEYFIDKMLLSGTENFEHIVEQFSDVYDFVYDYDFLNDTKIGIALIKEKI